MRTLRALAGSIDAFKICICASCGLNFATSEEVKFGVKTNLWCTCSCYILVSRKVFWFVWEKESRGLAQITAISGIGVFCHGEKHFRSADDVGQGGVCLPANMMQRFWEAVFSELSPSVWKCWGGFLSLESSEAEDLGVEVVQRSSALRPGSRLRWLQR